jgi:GntR family transcriptional repressor for pyruvate dehydrogenase complex
MVDAVRKPRLAMQVAALLATSMIERNLAPGDRLPAERDLAAAFAVSRHVVREALGRLEARGLVTIDHGRGTVVLTRPTSQDLASFVANVSESPAPSQAVSLEARSVFEAGLADLIVANATEEAIARLEEIVANLTSEVESGQPVGADDVAFHEQLLRCTNNSLLIKTGQRLVLGHLQSHLRSEYRVGVSEEALEAIDLYEHNEIVAAIRRKDVDRLRMLLRYHGYQFDSVERAAAGLPAPKTRATARK